MQGYSTQDVARLLDLSAQRVRSYARAGFVSPGRGPRNQYIFSFQDLVLLRTAAELSRAHLPEQRIMSALARLKAQLPVGRSLTELRIHASGEEIVARASGEPPWNPESGQFHMEFDVSELAVRVAPIAQRLSERAQASTAERTAAEWFELAVDLEAVAPDEARAAYERALELEPGFTDARVNLGRLLQEGGATAEAEAEYRRVLQEREHALAAYNLGVVLEDRGEAADAIRSYARAIAADPALAEAHYNLARLYEARGDNRAAIRHFNGYRKLVRLRGKGDARDRPGRGDSKPDPPRRD